jgi:hypothetical protein
MAVAFGTIVNGQSVSSAFELKSTDKALLVGISSHAALLFYASFAVTSGGTFVRFLDPWATSGCLLGVAGGGWGTVQYPPTTFVRIEASAAVSATTSFSLVEVSPRS